MKSFAIIAILWLYGLSHSFAQVYLHNFGITTISTHPYTVSPGIFDANLNTSSWINSSGSFTNLAGATGQALAVPSIGNGGTLELRVNINFGRYCSLNSFSFAIRGGSTALTGWSLNIEGVNVGSGSITTTITSTGTISFSNIDVVDGTINALLTFSGTSSTNVRIDDFRLNGSTSSSNTINRPNALIFAN